MKSILFILSSYATGGIVSSLISILNSELKNEYKMNTFTLVNEGGNNKLFAHFDIGHNILTTAYRVHRENVSVKFYPVYLTVRIIKVLCSFLGVDFEGWMNKHTCKQINTLNYDYIVAFSEGLATKFVSEIDHPQKIAWIHCDYKRCVKSIATELALYQHFYKIVCVSAFTRQSFVDLFPTLAGKTLFIHNIVDEVNIMEKSLIDISDEHFNTLRFTIVSIGRISSVKRFSLIPQIASELRNLDCVFNWYIIGPADEKDEYETLVENQNRYSTEDCVHILGAKNNPYPYVKRASLLVSLSSSEACPMIFNEAQILNVPILTANFGSAFEFIRDGENGYITSIEGMSGKLCELIKRPELIENIRMKQYDNPNGEILHQLHQLLS